MLGSYYNNTYLVLSVIIGAFILQRQNFGFDSFKAVLDGDNILPVLQLFLLHKKNKFQRDEALTFLFLP